MVYLLDLPVHSLKSWRNTETHINGNLVYVSHQTDHLDVYFVAVHVWLSIGIIPLQLLSECGAWGNGGSWC